MMQTTQCPGDQIRSKMCLLGYAVLISILVLPIALPVSSSSSLSFAVDGTVLELTDSNFDAAISKFDYIFVDFFAPWCGHCQRLSPELDAAAPILAKLKEPIVIAKLNADRYSGFARKLEISAFPTLMLYTHGRPMGYYGPRKADLLVRYLKKFVASDVAVLDSDSAVKDFVKEAGTYFPIFIGFGMNESSISALGVKYKKKAWFAVSKDFSEDIMVSYDFDKVPALVASRPKFNEQSVFYGPFEDGFLEEFVKQNFLPLTVPINQDTLKLLKDDDRKIVLAIVEDEADERSKQLIKVLRAAAHANRDLVFGYVGVQQFDDFADSFEANKKYKTAKDGRMGWRRGVSPTSFLKVIGAETIDEDDQPTQVSKFLEGYKAGRTEKKKIKGSSFTGFIGSMIGITLLFIVVFLIAVVLMIRSLVQDVESPSIHPGEKVALTRNAERETDSIDQKLRNKED